MFCNRGSCDLRHIRREAVGVENKSRRSRPICLMMTAVLFCACASYAKYSGGDGNSNNPFLISSPEDLAQIGNNPDDWDKHFLLMSDLDMKDYNSTNVFAPIGYFQWDPYISKPFKGVFDGNKKRILNLTINRNRKDFTGLFGYVYGRNAIIRDTTLVNPKINGLASMYTGTIAGKLRNGTVTGCNIEGGVISGTNYVGGLIGYNLNGAITNCGVETTIYGSTGVGGITGYHCGNIMQNCSFSGTIHGQCDMGGLAGSNDGQIVNCYVKGTLIGNEDKVAGLVGTSRGLVKYSYAIANVTGHQQTGGLIGRNTGNISDCYAQGTVTGSYCVGGLVGLLYDEGTVSRCYAAVNLKQKADLTGNLVGLADSGTITASFSPDNASTSQLMTEDTYTKAGWKFNGDAANSAGNPWTICEGMSYPRLSWERLNKGDYICPDGVDVLDIGLIFDHWLAKTASMDISPRGGDGIVNFYDWVAFSLTWKKKRSSLGWNAQCDIWPEGGDGVIDEADLTTFMNRWLTNGAGPYDIAPDFRGDQIINFVDFAAAAENYRR
jgi:hypothetical protein